MTIDELFDELDLDMDGALSRSDLHGAALRLGWQWQEASTYAVLDLLALRKPLSREQFASFMTKIAQDPLGPYGEALRSASRFSHTVSSNSNREPDCKAVCQGDPCHSPEEDTCGAIVSHLESVAGADAGNDYRLLVDELAGSQTGVSAADSALLLIDLQRSFTSGAWMQSLGASADSESVPIRLAFDNCARLLRGRAQGVEKMFTRCPFPPDSYDWDERFATIPDSSQPYFVKPGNSVLWPPTNGFAEWVEGLIDRGIKTLLMGGCTLNSCVRVSAIDTQRQFADRGLRVAVVLSLSGARTSNYLRSAQFGGVSSVELAVRDMISAGVSVWPDLVWI